MQRINALHFAVSSACCPVTVVIEQFCYGGKLSDVGFAGLFPVACPPIPARVRQWLLSRVKAYF
jgi:hypothetical protein